MKKLRMIVDCAMILLLPMLMAYSLIGELFHEIIGTAMLALFITHNILNLGFWKNIFKGRYNAARVFRTVVNACLLAIMILQPLSGIAMSKHLYVFLPSLGLTATARQIHMVLAYWGFVLMSIHAGTHFGMLAGRLKKKLPKAVNYCLFGVGTAVMAYGAYTFVKRGLPGYMFMKTPFVFFDYDEPLVNFFADYLSVIILFGGIGFWIHKVFLLIAKKRTDGD